MRDGNEEESILKKTREHVLLISDIEFDELSDIKVGDVVLLYSYIKEIVDSIKSENNMVIVKDIIPITDYMNEAYIVFENKNNEIESNPISLFKKVKTYPCSEVNHKPGNFFFLLEEIGGVRKKNIVYKVIDYSNPYGNSTSEKVYYRSLDNTISRIHKLDTIVFINVNNNLDLKCNEYKKNNSYLKLLDSINKQDMVKKL